MEAKILNHKIQSKEMQKEINDLPILGIIIVRGDCNGNLPILDRSDDERTLSSRETYELIYGESNASDRQITSKLYNLRTYHGLEPIPGSRPCRYSSKAVKKYINNNGE